MFQDQSPVRSACFNPQKLWMIAGLSAIAFSCAQIGFGGEWLNVDGWPLLVQFLQASLQPDLSSELLQITGQATLTTLAYAVCGTVLSLLLGLVGGLLTSEVWGWTLFPLPSHRQLRVLCLGVRAVLAVPRSIHELLWGLLLINLWGLDPLTAIVAITIPYSAIVTKVFAEILDETPRKPLLALLNSGVAPWSAVAYGLLPQAYLNLISYSFYRFECAIRSAAVLGIIGAGGLGHQIFLSLQSVRYQQLWTFFYALIFLNGLVDLTSAWIRHRLGCSIRLDLNLHQHLTLHPPSDRYSPVSSSPSHRPFPPVSTPMISLGLVLVAIGCFGYVGADFSKLGSPQTLITLSGWLPTLWSLELQDIQLTQIVILSGQTLMMSVLAIAAAGLMATVLSFPATHTFFRPGGLFSPPQQGYVERILSWLLVVGTRVLLLVCRAIPAPIWALVVLFVLFPGILPGAIALGIHNLGILGRLMAEGNETLNRSPLEALQAQGAASFLVFLYGVLPLTLPRFLAYSFYRWEVCVRETVIVGLVGAGGLGRLLMEQLSSFDVSGMIVTLGCFVLLTLGVDWASGAVRRCFR